MQALATAKKAKKAIAESDTTGKQSQKHDTTVESRSSLSHFSPLLTLSSLSPHPNSASSFLLSQPIWGAVNVLFFVFIMGVI